MVLNQARGQLYLYWQKELLRQGQ